MYENSSILGTILLTRVEKIIMVTMNTVHIIARNRSNMVTNSIKTVKIIHIKKILKKQYLCYFLNIP